jgi:hypothetical protein
MLRVIQVEYAVIFPLEFGVEGGRGIKGEGRGFQTVALLGEDLLIVCALDVLLI